MLKNFKLFLLYIGISSLLLRLSRCSEIDYIHSPLLLQDINFLHTTDTHTWLKNKFGIDWGNYNTFLKNFREKISPEKDLIVIDTGDKIDGNGLGDATTPKGLMSYDIFNMNMDQMDLLTIGNHELYTSSSSYIEYYTAAKDNVKYVSSNVEFFDKKLNDWVPFGNKYRYFETANSKKILALSFLFDFQRYNEFARVTSIEKEIEKDWIQKDLFGEFNDDNIDLLLIFGHLPIQHGQNQELLSLHEFLRQHFKTSIIQYFGGHSHIRDFISIDDKATALQSGRFCETVGFLSLNLNENPNFFRKYLDFNKESFDYHLNSINAKPIDWSKKNEISQKIDNVFEILQLGEVKGYIPETYYMNNKPLSSRNNLFNLITNKILPRMEKPVGRENVKRMITVNTGLIRFDLLKGSFTENTKYQISPYDNKWRAISIPYHFARNIKDYLNSQSSILSLSALHPVAEKHLNIETFEQDTFNMRTLSPEEKSRNKQYNLPLGPVTCDDFGCDGEDTLHKPLNYFRMPNVVQYSDVIISETEEVDFVYLDFFELEVFRALETMNYEGALNSRAYISRGVVPLLQEYFGVSKEI
ncbi:hypothetical protein ACO0SA_002204 [Hanseniaspora valbyensis]